MSDFWEIFDWIGAAKPDADGTLDGKVDAWVSAVTERIADSWTSLSQESLGEGAAAARKAFEQLERIHPMDPTSPSFIAGRIASAADLLGFAASRTAQDEAASLARRSPYSQALSALSDGALRNIDLGKQLGKSEAQICRILKELRDVNLVAPQRRGREVFNVLTPIGRLTVEEGIQDMRRAPLTQTNVVDFSANRPVTLNELSPTKPVGGSSLPRLRTQA